jgi:hypothetical protein
MIRTMLTTLDNPYSPFDDFAAWYAYDMQSGYNTTSFLARITKTSYELSSADYDLEIEDAINEIVKENVLGIYRKVTKEFPDY